MTSRAPHARAWLWAALVVTVTLPALWPFLRHAGYWESHDGLFHLYRLLSLEAAWQQGHFYPRLFPDFAFGYGFAVLHFYGPLTYSLALALRGLGLAPIAAIKATYALSYPLAALAIWWLARDLWRREEEGPNELAGLVAAAAYTYVPYHLADVQLRGALAESWAFVLWPLLFWAVWRLPNNARPWPLALAMAALILTHNLSVVLVALPLALWALLALIHGTRHTGHEPRAWPFLRALASSAGLALALTAFYWLPVVLESRYVWVAQDVGGLGFARHLAPLREWLAAGPDYRYFPDQGVAGEHPLSWAQGALLALAATALPGLWRSRWRAVALFWWGVLVGALLLLTPWALPIWRTVVFPFGLVQYPWRWLGLVGLATALLASSPFALRRSPPGAARVPSALYALVTAVLLLWLAQSSLAPLPWLPRDVDVAQHPVTMWAEDAATGQVGATWTAEFLPLTVTEQRWALARAPETVANEGAETPLRVTGVTSDGWTWEVAVEAVETGWLLFPRFAYPSMAATVDGAPTPVEPRGALGLAGVEVPSGSHRVTLGAFPLADKPWLRWGLAALAGLVVAGGLARWWRPAPLLLAPLLLVLWLVPMPDTTTVPDPAGTASPIAIGEQAWLVAVRRPATTQRGGALPVRLLWFNRRQTAQRFNTFVHLTPTGGGAPLAQHDGEPNAGTVPTSRWQPGQLVEDLHLLRLPDDLPPGSYELWGGMYALENDAAVPVPGDGGERRFLGLIQVR